MPQMTRTNRQMTNEPNPPEIRMATIRKPITAMMTRDWQRDEGDGMQGNLVVVCDDGAVFIYDWNEGEWGEMAPVPGSRREPIKQKAEASEKAAGERRMLAALDAAVKKQAKSRG